jgi:hypothetical protein
MTIKINGELELDLDRGVVYFHSGENGNTVLRICGLEFPKGFNPAANRTDSFDVTLKFLEKHPVSYMVQMTESEQLRGAEKFLSSQACREPRR